jgi:hypothetical protein
MRVTLVLRGLLRRSYEKVNVFMSGIKWLTCRNPQMKTVLITLFDIKCIVHFQFIPQGQTLNQAYYVEILKRLGEVVHSRKRHEL